MPAWLAVPSVCCSGEPTSPFLSISLLWTCFVDELSILLPFRMYSVNNIKKPYIHQWMSPWPWMMARIAPWFAWNGWRIKNLVCDSSYETFVKKKIMISDSQRVLWKSWRECWMLKIKIAKCSCSIDFACIFLRWFLSESGFDLFTSVLSPMSICRFITVEPARQPRDWGLG